MKRSRLHDQDRIWTLSLHWTFHRIRRAANSAQRWVSPLPRLLHCREIAQYIYIYIKRERERKREKERDRKVTSIDKLWTAASLLIFLLTNVSSLHISPRFAFLEATLKLTHDRVNDTQNSDILVSESWVCIGHFTGSESRQQRSGVIFAIAKRLLHAV